MSLPENNDQNLDNTNDQHENEERKKVVYKEPNDSHDDTDVDNGDSSSISDIGRTNLTNTPRRSNKPLGSAHEPGTMPGSNNL